MLNESIHNHAALKFVFLAGGAGSGKNYIANELFGIEKGASFGATGMKMVSFDAIFEKLLDRFGYPRDLSQLSDEDRDAVMDEYNPDSVYAIARKVMKKQLKNHLKRGNGIIFDGTGRVVGGYLEKKWTAEKLGYDTHLIFVDVPLETALERNARRERRLPDETVAKIHRDVQRNRGEYERVFGDNMMVIENDNGAQISNDIRQRVAAIVGEPVKNPIGRYRMEHNGQLPPREEPKHKADPTPKPQIHHANPDGSHTVFTDKGKMDSQQMSMQLFPGEIEGLKKRKDAAAQDVDLSPEAPKPKKPETSWWQAFKKKHAEKMGKVFGGKKDTNLKSLVPGQERIHNPETGNDILVTTALGYPPGHPMRVAAEKIARRAK